MAAKKIFKYKFILKTWFFKAFGVFYLAKQNICMSDCYSPEYSLQTDFRPISRHGELYNILHV